MSKWKNKFNWDQIKKDIDENRTNKKAKWEDDRFWVPNWKQAVATEKFFTFRFIPDPDGNPFVKYYSHSFKYNKDDSVKWYINNCISTFGWDPQCPICEKNNEYYNSAFESDKKIAQQRKRRINFVSNVLIIDDPINPENNGKTMLYRYGIKIYEKIEKLLFPTDAMLADPDFEAYMPFDLFEGANFKLKIKMQGEFPNYDDSEFSVKRGPVLGGDEDKIDELMEKSVVLQEFLDPEKYPSVEDTVRQIGSLLNMSLGEGGDTAGGTPEEKSQVKKDDDNPFLNNSSSESTPEEETGTESAPQEEDPSAEESGSGESGGGDDDEAFFANLK